MADDRPYITTGELLLYFLKLLIDNKEACMVRKRLANTDVNTFSGVLGFPWKKVDGALFYDNKPYIPLTLQTKIMASHHDNSLVRYFGIEKTQEVIAQKYY